MPQRIPTYRGVVYPWHCDHMGHMNVMWYAGKFDEATWHLLAAVGLTPAYLRENSRGMVAVDQHTTYRAELRAGDLVVVDSFVEKVTEKTIVFVHEMRNGESGELSATTRLTGVHIDSAARRACPFPEEVAKTAGELFGTRPS